MQRPCTILAVVLTVSWITYPSHALARESNGTPVAKAVVAQGEAAVKAGKLAEAVAAFRKAIDADPDYVEAHQRYIEITRRQEDPGSRTPVVPKLQQQYERWARQYPTRAVYQWALGFLEHDADKSDAYLRRALAIDPSLARAHFQLARNADLRGDFAAQREHLKAAYEINPDEPRYLLRYAYAQRKSDPQRFRALTLEVVAKFPATQQAAEALYDLAEESSNPERRTYFDRLRAEYPVDRFGYSASAMYDLYAELTTPSEALSVAREMAKAFPASKSWSQRIVVQEAMMRAQALIADRKFADAFDAIGQTDRPSGNHGVTWTLLKAEAAAGAGHVDQAYNTVLDALTIVPDGRLEAALMKFGAALGRANADVSTDVWRARDAKARLAPAFELPSSHGGAPIKLADYRGKLVLLAFWFPG
jgi:tetratricopeptide (TPR) repeat protein